MHGIPASDISETTLFWSRIKSIILGEISFSLKLSYLINLICAISIFTSINNFFAILVSSHKIIFEFFKVLYALGDKSSIFPIGTPITFKINLLLSALFIVIFPLMK